MLWPEAGLMEEYTRCLRCLDRRRFGHLWALSVGPMPGTALVAALTTELRRRVEATLKTLLVSPRLDGPFGPVLDDLVGRSGDLAVT